MLSKTCKDKYFDEDIKEDEKDEIIKRLNLTDTERANLLKNGYWYPDISNNTGFKGV